MAVRAFRVSFRSAKVVGLAVALLAAGGVVYAKHVGTSRRAAGARATLAAAVARGDPVLRVPHVSGDITLDGDTDDPAWVRPPGPARTGSFVFRDGPRPSPHSEARLLWSDEYLYLALFASDEDIESHPDEPDGPIGREDAFRLVFSRPGVDYALEVSPKAVIADSIRRGDGAWDLGWKSGAHASKEVDGTINHPKDLDEEWAVELAIPLESLGLKGEPGENIGMSLSRCDTPKGSPTVCSGWGEDGTDRGNGRIVLQ
jgi:hypothetical protein